MSLILIPALPLAAALLALAPWGRRTVLLITIVSALADFCLVLHEALRVARFTEVAVIPNWVVLDSFGSVVLLLISFVALTAALFSWGYIGAHQLDDARVRDYGLHFNLFVFALVLVPVLAQPAMVWIAIEFTAVFSVLLVAFDNTQSALEAAWKYIALMVMGAAIALLGFFILFWAQQQGGGGPFSWDGLRAAAPRLPAPLMMAAFLLILVGFGAKVGFVPLHTWLPDAHSQAPSPVCALLSGVKTTAVLYVILRLVPLMPAASVLTWMRVVGLVSLGAAALLLLQVADYKRLFAYSTVEHMGIIFLAAGLGGRGGFYAAMLQMISHSLTKSFCFLAAGAALLVLGTREIAAVRGLIRTSPAAGTALLFGALAIGGAPPFAVFLSEFSIVRAGLEQRFYVCTALLVIFITIAFFGILMHINRMVFGVPATAHVTGGHGGHEAYGGHGAHGGTVAVLAPPESTQHIQVALPLSCKLTLGLAAIPVCVLGVYQPAFLHTLLAHAAASLTPLP